MFSIGFLFFFFFLVLIYRPKKRPVIPPTALLRILLETLPIKPLVTTEAFENLSDRLKANEFVIVNIKAMIVNNSQIKLSLKKIKMNQAIGVT